MWMSLPVEEDLTKSHFRLELQYVWPEGHKKLDLLISPGKYRLRELLQKIREKV
jgi:hypothetical protein